MNSQVPRVSWEYDPAVEKGQYIEVDEPLALPEEVQHMYEQMVQIASKYGVDVQAQIQMDESHLCEKPKREEEQLETFGWCIINDMGSSTDEE